jgi:hypothetical protein
MVSRDEPLPPLGGPLRNYILQVHRMRTTRPHVKKFWLNRFFKSRNCHLLALHRSPTREWRRSVDLIDFKKTRSIGPHRNRLLVSRSTSCGRPTRQLPCSCDAQTANSAILLWRQGIAPDFSYNVPAKYNLYWNRLKQRFACYPDGIICCQISDLSTWILDDLR